MSVPNFILNFATSPEPGKVLASEVNKPSTADIVGTLSGVCGVSWKTIVSGATTLVEVADGERTIRVQMDSSNVFPRVSTNGYGYLTDFSHNPATDTLGLERRVDNLWHVTKNGISQYTFPASSTPATVRYVMDYPQTLPAGFSNINATGLSPSLDIASEKFVATDVPLVLSATPEGFGRPDTPTYQWTRSSGLGGTLSGATTATLTASDLPAGIHTFSCTATWADASTAMDEVTVTVLAPPVLSVKIDTGAGETAVTQGSTQNARVDNGFDLIISESTDVAYSEITFGDEVINPFTSAIVQGGLLAKNPEVRYAYRKTGTYQVTITAWSIHPSDYSTALANDLKTVLTFTVAVAPDYTFGAPQVFTSVAALQAAVNLRNGGENYELAAGEYEENALTIEPRTVSAPVRIAVQGLSLLRNNRVTKADTPQLAVLHGKPNGNIHIYGEPECSPSLIIKQNVTDILFEGFNFNVKKGRFSYTTVNIGAENAQNLTVASVPKRIRFRHCLGTCESDRTQQSSLVTTGSTLLQATIATHGQARKHLLAHAYQLEVFDSAFLDTQTFDNSDNYSVGCWDAGGSHLFYNTAHQADTEDVIYGGNPTSIEGWIPNRLTFFRCRFSKDPVRITDGSVRFTKNNFELKTGTNCVVDSFLIHHVWASRNEQGVSVVLTPQPDSQQATVKYFQMTRGRVSYAPRSIAIYGRRLGAFSGENTNADKPRSENLLFEDVLFHNIDNDAQPTGGQTWNIYVAYDPQNLHFRNATLLNQNNSNGFARNFNFDPNDPDPETLKGFRLEDSVVGAPQSGYGIWGGAATNHAANITRHTTDAVIRGNLSTDWSGGGVPGFTNTTLADALKADYTVKSAFQIIGTNNSTPGADVALIDFYTLNTEDGQWAIAEDPPAPDITAPTGTLTASSSSVLTAQSVTLSFDAADNEAVESVSFKEGTSFPVSVSPPLVVREMPFVSPDLEIRNEELFAARAIERAGQLCPQLTNAAPSSPHVVLLETLAWMLAQGARRLNYVPKKTLLEFAALFNITPRAATAAIVTLKFFTASPVSDSIPIPQGTLVIGLDGEVVFQTTHDSKIPAGYDFAEITARALTVGNRHIPVASLTSLQNAIAGVSVTNERSITSGTDDEALESVLERATSYLRRGERLVSTADVESAIVDEVMGGRGVVRGFPLVVDGQFDVLRPGHTTLVVMDAAGDAVDDSIKKRINALLEERVGNQFFYVRDPAYRAFDVQATLAIAKGYDTQTVFASVAANLRAEYAAVASNLGRTILTTEIVAIIVSTLGVERLVASRTPASLLRAPLMDIPLLAYELPAARNIQLFPLIVPK